MAIICRTLAIYFLGTILLTGCENVDDKKIDHQTALLLKIDSLNDVIDVNQKFTTTLLQVGQLIDSIDNNRDMIRLNLEEADPMENYVGRMREINQYIKASHAKLNELEKGIRKGDKQMKMYAMIIKNLKEEISAKSLEISRLKQQVDEFKTRMVELTEITDSQGHDLLKKQETIVKQESEITRQLNQIEKARHELRSTQAEQYFKEAAALELAATRTKLAPRKKKATLREALDLYRQSLASGNPEAQVKIDELQEKVN